MVNRRPGKDYSRRPIEGLSVKGYKMMQRELDMVDDPRERERELREREQGRGK